MTVSQTKELQENIPCTVEIRQWGRTEFVKHKLIRANGNKSVITDKGKLFYQNIAEYQNIETIK